MITEKPIVNPVNILVKNVLPPLFVLLVLPMLEELIKFPVNVILDTTKVDHPVCNVNLLVLLVMLMDVYLALLDLTVLAKTDTTKVTMTLNVNNVTLLVKHVLLLLFV